MYGRHEQPEPSRRRRPAAPYVRCDPDWALRSKMTASQKDLQETDVAEDIATSLDRASSAWRAPAPDTLQPSLSRLPVLVPDHRHVDIRPLTLVTDPPARCPTAAASEGRSSSGSRHGPIIVHVRGVGSSVQRAGPSPQAPPTMIINPRKPSSSHASRTGQSL